MVRRDSRVETLADLRNVPIAVTWHAGTFYAAVEAMEAAGVLFSEIKLEHAADRLGALLSGGIEAAALMEPLVSRAIEAGCRKIAELRWRGGIVAADEIDAETAEKLRRGGQPASQRVGEEEKSAPDRNLPAFIPGVCEKEGFSR